MSARLPELALTVTVRDGRPADREALAQMLASMDKYGLYQRHFSHGEGPNLALLDRLSQQDRTDAKQQAVVLAESAGGKLIGHGEFVAEDVGIEFALMVLPPWRGLGVARQVLEALVERGRAAGHEEMHGMIQSGNTAMLHLSNSLGFVRGPSDDASVVLVARRLRE